MLEIGSGNPNVGRPGYESSITAEYKSGDMGLALMEADEDLQGGESEVPFALGKLKVLIDTGVLEYRKGEEVKAYLPIAELRALWNNLYGPIADYNIRTCACFIGRKAIMEFSKQGLLSDLEGWRQPKKGKLQPTSWWRQAGYMSNG